MAMVTADAAADAAANAAADAATVGATDGAAAGEAVLAPVAVAATVMTTAVGVGTRPPRPPPAQLCVLMEAVHERERELYEVYVVDADPAQSRFCCALQHEAG
ncbi:hypothetical protein I4F81_005285 [Pyropia yezoensis]|uniref:Uncharacterized protein n=1 Tax=Pyropia yezoensis TaxID=2788 RepID=A0ACC3BXX7_PYRYE|nr:hypothetical protein I4F81_005285 [Neopyropia yezoensis]